MDPSALQVRATLGQLLEGLRDGESMKFRMITASICGSEDDGGASRQTGAGRGAPETGGGKR